MIALLLSVAFLFGGTPAPDPDPSAGAGRIAWWSYSFDRPLFDQDGVRVAGVVLRCYVPAHGRRYCKIRREP